MDYDLIVVKTLERVYKNYYYIIRGKEEMYPVRCLRKGMWRGKEEMYPEGSLKKGIWGEKE